MAGEVIGTFSEDQLRRIAHLWASFRADSDRRDREAARESDINERGAA